jgi:RHS repeat-associated protein
MSGASTVATYAYDGQNRRTTKSADGSTRHYYYSNQWQVLEERVGASTSADRQFVWGLRYIDDLILRDRGAERLYALHDYFNCTAAVGTSGAVQERYGYDAFGAVRFMTAAFGSHSASLYEWETLYAAYRWDAESGLYQVRNRYLHAKLGRWVRRDPLGERAGPNLYLALSNSSVNSVDPMGLYDNCCCDQQTIRAGANILASRYVAGKAYLEARKVPHGGEDEDSCYEINSRIQVFITPRHTAGHVTWSIDQWSVPSIFGEITGL